LFKTLQIFFFCCLDIEFLVTQPNKKDLGPNQHGQNGRVEIDLSKLTIGHVGH
jgi:hypothetical protein